MWATQLRLKQDFVSTDWVMAAMLLQEILKAGSSS